MSIKPVAWMYEKPIEGIDVPTRIVLPYKNPSLIAGDYPWTQTLLYAIPDTHRVVSVELLKEAVGQLSELNTFAAIRAIIEDKENKQ